MPGTSSDRESSPTPSYPPAEDQEDAAVDESTPFISSDNPPANPSFPNTIHTATALALTFSILTLVFLFATAVARQAGPVSFNLPWSTKEGLNGVVAPVGRNHRLDARLYVIAPLREQSFSFSYAGNLLPPFFSIQPSPPSFR